MNRSSTLTRQQKDREDLVNQRREVALLQELVTLNKQQIQFGLPAIPDQPLLKIKRDKVHTFSVTTAGDNLSTSTSLTTTKAYNFTLTPSGTTSQGAANSTEFTSLFDQWRIAQVVVEINPASFLDSLGNQQPIYVAIDYDDSNTPGSLSSLQEYGTCQTTSFGKFCQRVFKPRFAVASYSGAFTSFSQSLPNQWIDVASPSVQHYGLKIGVGATPSVTQIYLSFRIVYQFRNNR